MGISRYVSMVLMVSIMFFVVGSAVFVVYSESSSPQLWLWREMVFNGSINYPVVGLSKSSVSLNSFSVRYGGGGGYGVAVDGRYGYYLSVTYFENAIGITFTKFDLDTYNVVLQRLNMVYDIVGGCSVARALYLNGSLYALANCQVGDERAPRIFIFNVSTGELVRWEYLENGLVTPQGFVKGSMYSMDFAFDPYSNTTYIVVAGDNDVGQYFFGVYTLDLSLVYNDTVYESLGSRSALVDVDCLYFACFAVGTIYGRYGYRQYAFPIYALYKVMKNDIDLVSIYVDTGYNYGYAERVSIVNENISVVVVSTNPYAGPVSFVGARTIGYSYICIADTVFPNGVNPVKYCFEMDSLVDSVATTGKGDAIGIWYVREDPYNPYYLSYLGYINILSSGAYVAETYIGSIPVEFYPQSQILGSRVLFGVGDRILVGEVGILIPAPFPIPRELPTATATPTAPAGGIGMEWLLIAMAIIGIGGIAVATRR